MILFKHTNCVLNLEMDEDCNLYLHRGSTRFSGKCNRGISSILSDGGIDIKAGECRLIVACHGPTKRFCVSNLRCADLPPKIDEHNWNSEYHFIFTNR